MFKYKIPEFIKEMLDSLDGDERFTMVLIIGAANSCLLATGCLTGGEYITALGMVFGFYSLGKTSENIVSSKNEVEVTKVTGVASTDKRDTSE